MEAMRSYHLAVEQMDTFAPDDGRERLLTLAQQFV
jgi:hypothetical protein